LYKRDRIEDIDVDDLEELTKSYWKLSSIHKLFILRPPEHEKQLHAPCLQAEVRFTYKC